MTGFRFAQRNFMDSHIEQVSFSCKDDYTVIPLHIIKPFPFKGE